MTDYKLLKYDRLQVIKDVISKNGEENFYISFSGGKDSTVLHHSIDEALPNNNIPRVFINTGIEYRFIQEFVKDMAKVDKRIQIVNSGVNIPTMLKEKGFPFKSKLHAEFVHRYQQKGAFEKANLNYYLGLKATGIEASAKFKCPQKLKYQFSDSFKLPISAYCCNELKKKPLHKWEKDNNRPIAIIGTRQEEGGARAMHQGCVLKQNGKIKKFKPLNPCSEDFEDWYIKTRKIELCKLYYPPYNFERTGCKGCPFAIKLQNELEIMEKYLPNERKQCEIIWKPVYEEYRKIGYRLKKVEQRKLF